MENDTVESFIARIFPCKPPCGVCENCCKARLIRVGAGLAIAECQMEADRQLGKMGLKGAVKFTAGYPPVAKE